MTRSFTPNTIAEAVELLADPELGAIPVAGCTDLLVVDTATGRRHKTVVDLTRISALHGIRETISHAEIGAMTTFSELRRHPTITAHFPILAKIAGTIGGWQIQNRATLGGNIANASPVGDSLPVLLALDAELELASPSGSRTLAYHAMHLAYRKTALAPGELIASVRLPLPSKTSRQFVKKVGTREAQAISKVVVALTADVDPSANTLGHVRCAAGSVAATPVRLHSVEQGCEGRVADAALADAAERLARAAVTPIDDVRSTAQYRAWTLGRIVRRMLLAATEPNHATSTRKPLRSS